MYKNIQLKFNYIIYLVYIISYIGSLKFNSLYLDLHV